MDKNKLYEIAEKMEFELGQRQFIDALLAAMSSDELQENLEYIDEVYETNCL